MTVPSKMSRTDEVGRLGVQDALEVPEEPEPEPISVFQRLVTIVDENAWFPPRCDDEFLMYKTTSWTHGRLA